MLIVDYRTGAVMADHGAAASGESSVVDEHYGGAVDPKGFVGQLFATMRPYAAPHPPGAQPPPMLSCDEHVRGLLGEHVTDVIARRQSDTADRFAAPDAFRDYVKSNYQLLDRQGQPD